MANPLDEFLNGASREDLWALSGEEMLKDLGLEPDPWQAEVINARWHRALLNCSRQSGKSTITAALALHNAMFPPKGSPTLTLLISPSLRQSGELFRKVKDLYAKLGKPVAAEQETALTLQLENGSRIVSLPNSEATIRGFSAVSLVIIDEASRVEDEIYKTLRPMLAVSNGRLICVSTPYGKQGFFYQEWFGDGPWKRVHIKADQCPRITQEFLEEERRALGDVWYRQEYECSFEVMEGLVYPEFADCVIDPVAIPADEIEGVYAGCDFGWDHPTAVVLAIRQKDGVLHIVDEIYYSRLTDEELVPALAALSDNWGGIQRMWCDTSHGQSIEKLIRGNIAAVLKADKRPGSVSGGIRAVAARIRQGRLKCWRTCKNLIREAGLYHYDPERTASTDDPVKQYDHSMDALRYLVMGMDRRERPQDVNKRELPVEPRKPIDHGPDGDYRKPVPQERYSKPQPISRHKDPESEWEQSEECRQLQCEYLEQHGWETLP